MGEVWHPAELGGPDAGNRQGSGAAAEAQRLDRGRGGAGMWRSLRAGFRKKVDL